MRLIFVWRGMAASGLVSALLCGCHPAGSGGNSGGPAPAQPGTTEKAGPPPGELRDGLARAQLPKLAQAADVPAFVAAAGAASVSRREEVRKIIQGAQGNAEIAKGLIAAFEKAQKEDHSRALVILSLIGEQRNPAGTAFLIDFVRRPLPTGGKPTEESGQSPEAEAMERLQVKAVTGIPYARTKEALQATLEIVGRNPSKAVRVEAASAYLWNQGNSAEARKALSQYLRKDEQMLLDRPVRDVGMSGEQFNRQLALYLERHPELRAPAPARGKAREGAADEAAGPQPPSDTASTK